MATPRTTRSTPPPARRDGSAGLGAVLWYVHSVLISLALLSGSWRSAPAERVDLFAPVEPVGALETDLLVQDATAEPPHPVRARVAVGNGLAAALRSIAPAPGQTLPIDSETLWLARCIYSESDRPHEQELVAWVVRNRVATGYRGERSYEGVVLDPRQFSAFNGENPRRGHYLSLQPEDGAPGWRRALLIAAYVRRAPWSRRPFGVGVRHFYSEVSMVGRRHPTWAEGETPVRANRPYDVDPFRFRFFALSREL